VWINGRHLGHRPYGYSSFEYDLTPFLKFGAERNVIAVRVDHSKAADSRWYTGSGIYRHVWLVSTQPLHVGHWGTYVYTPVVTQSQVLVTVETGVANDSQKEAAVRLVTTIEDAAGKEVASAESPGRIPAGGTSGFVHQAAVRSPALWSAAPILWIEIASLFSGGTPLVAVM
jgi:beta-galactosidase